MFANLELSIIDKINNVLIHHTITGHDVLNRRWKTLFQ